jgi:phosphoglycolate phosphatase-like HAD superfamily hydrolase
VSVQDPSPQPEQPASVRGAVYLAVIAFAIALANTYRLAPQVSAQLNPVILWGYTAVTSVLWLLLMFLVFRGRNWARWVFCVFSFLGIPGTLFANAIGGIDMGTRVVSISQALLNGAAAVLLLIPSSARWYRALKARAVLVAVSLGLALAFGAPATARAADPLPSWNDGAAKQAIIDFVARVTKPGSPDFVAPAERIATFDNDGTLWVEQPMYVQLFFALNRVKALAPKHPDWKTQEPFASVLKDDVKTALAGGEKAIVDLIMATHTGNTTDEFAAIVEEWLATARHPTTKRPFTDMVYQPMLEVLAHLRENGFKTFIVSGGGIDFMRPWTERVYGIPPEQVVGSSVKTSFEMRGDTPVLVRLPKVNFIDDKAGKPVGINEHIGRRPILAFGNSDGDLEMLQWTTAGSGPRLGLIVHHTDAKREWAYDRHSAIGKLSEALDQAPARGWVVVDMKQDWKVIYPFEKQ